MLGTAGTGFGMKLRLFPDFHHPEVTANVSLVNVSPDISEYSQEWQIFNYLWWKRDDRQTWYTTPILRTLTLASRLKQRQFSSPSDSKKYLKIFFMFSREPLFTSFCELWQFLTVLNYIGLGEKCFPEQRFHSLLGPIHRNEAILYFKMQLVQFPKFPKSITFSILFKTQDNLLIVTPSKI